MSRIARIAALGAVVVSAFVLGAIGLREILLRQVDCVTCRRAYTLLYPPNDYNAPIAMAHVAQGRAAFYLFPAYVGPYFVEAFQVPSGPEVGIDRFECKDNITFKPMPGNNARNKVFSRFGNGVILGAVYMTPENVGKKTRPACQAVFTSNVDFLLVISRASQL